MKLLAPGPLDNPQLSKKNHSNSPNLKSGPFYATSESAESFSTPFASPFKPIETTTSSLSPTTSPFFLSEPNSDDEVVMPLQIIAASPPPLTPPPKPVKPKTPRNLTPRDFVYVDAAAAESMKSPFLQTVQSPDLLKIPLGILQKNIAQSTYSETGASAASSSALLGINKVH